MIDAAQIAEWRLERGRGMESALGEYTPAEFWALLDEVERLQMQLELTGKASRLIDAWAASHPGVKVPWRIAVSIIGIVNHLPDEEVQRLLALDAE